MSLGKNTNNLTKQLGWIVLVFSFFLYAYTVGHGYVLDDFSQIKNNKLTKQGTKAIPTLLKTSYRAGLDSGDDELYRPLSMVLFATLWSVAPDSPALYHAVLVILYSLLCWVLFMLLNRIFKNNYLHLTFMAAILFAVHPLHTEVVANIKSADEVMGLLFFALSLHSILIYIDENKLIHIPIAIVCFFLAALSKENMVMLVGIAPMVVLFFRNIKSKSSLIALLSLVPMAALYLYIRSSVLGDIDSFTVAEMDNALKLAKNYSQQFATAVFIIGKEICLCFFPHPLIVDYSYNHIPLVESSDPLFLLSFFICLGLVLYAVWVLFKKLTKKEDNTVGLAIAFGILFFFIALFPTSNIMLLIRCTMAERFLFLPSLGFSLALAALIYKLIIKKEPGRKITTLSDFLKHNNVFTSVLMVLVVIASLKTGSRAAQWKNEDILYTIDIKKAPNNAKLHYYYANHFVSNVKEGKVKGDSAIVMLNDAIAKARRSIEILPKYYESYFVIGQAYAELNNNKEAIENYKKAYSLGYPGSLVLNNLGNAFFKINMPDSAIKYLQLGLQYNPNNEQTWSNLGSAYTQKGLLFEAINAYNKALMINPNYTEAYTNLGSAYGLSKEYDKAILAFTEALKRDPDNATVNYYMGLTLQFKGDVQNAQPYLQKAYQLNPALAPANKK